MFEKLEDIDFLLRRLGEKRDEYTRELMALQDRIDRLVQERSVVEKEILVVEYKRLPKGQHEVPPAGVPEKGSE